MSTQTTDSTRLTFDVTRRTDPLPDAARAAIVANPGFGKKFTDHMVLATWTAGQGWHDGTVTAYGPLLIDPAAAVLHYAQEIFEGMKAYRHVDGSIWAFRPEANAARFARSARRLTLPELPEEDFLESLRALVSVDSAWVPEPGASGEKSLYLRPFMFASEVFLGVRPAAEVTYSVIASPAGAYFSGGVSPISLWISTDFARAGQLEGMQHGCDQAVFLDSSSQTHIEELGGMNLFLVYADGRIVTPELSGSILEGVTRSSILELAKDLGLTPEERRIPIDEWKDAARSGELAEVFACGTAAVVTPVGELRWEGGSVDHRGDGFTGEVSLSIRNQLLDIQYGRTEDTHDWLTRLA